MAKPLQFSELLRPRQLGDLTLPQKDLDRLQQMMQTNEIMGMIFQGRSGIGKTSAARILTDSPRIDAMELNGSSLTGIDAVRTRIEPFVSSMSFTGGLKVCFIDEADYLSKNAQASLQHLIEKCMASARFLFTVNELKKISPALQSRLMTVGFDISPCDRAEVLERLRIRYEKVLSQRNIDYDRKRLRQIIGIYFPDLREIANRVEYEFAVCSAVSAAPLGDADPG